MSETQENEEDFATILRRNTYDKFNGSFAEQPSQKIPLNRTLSARTFSAEDLSQSCKLNPKAFNSLNSFNDMGHLSRRVFNDHGENHLTSDDFENTFGYRKVFDNQLEVTAITATTIATCLSSILHELIVIGEKMSEEGHFNGSQYDIFCGGGKNLRTRHQPQLNARQKSEASFDASSNIQHCSSSHSNSASPKPHKKKKLVPIHVAEPIPTLQSITNFVAKLCNDTQTEYECIVISLIYVRRLIKNSNGELVLSKENWKGIIMSCIVLSNKVWDDFHMQNLDYCYVFNGLTLQRVNSLELQLLISMDTRCNVSPSVYAQTHFEIQAMITLTNIEKGKPKKIKNRFSAKFARVHPDENVDGAQKQIETVNMTNVEHPSPYRKFFDFDSLDKKTENTEGEENNSENSAHLSVDEYATFYTSAGLKIPAPAFSEGNDPEVEEPVGRKKLIHSVDLEKQKRHLRVLIQYDESSLITEPSVKTNNGSSKTGETNGSNTSMLSRGNSFKLAKQHSRKSFHGGGAFTALSPLAPIMSAKVTVSRAWWHCLPFSLCMGKVQDVVI